MPDTVFMLLVVFLGVFVQCVAGFGSALVAMPLLVPLLGLETATPLVAMMSIVTAPSMAWKYRHACQWGEVWRMMAGALPGVAVGLALPNVIDPHIVVVCAGVVVMAYAVYGLVGPHLPHIRNRAWATPFGAMAGLLYGAFNIGGPPVVIYGTCRRWAPNSVRANLQTQSVVIVYCVFFGHLFQGHCTTQVWVDFAAILPAMALALVVGFWLNRYVNAAMFRRIVLVLLVVVGAMLIFRSSGAPRDATQTGAALPAQPAQ